MSARYDALIRNTTIVDGTGKASYPGSVAVPDGRVAALGTVEGSAALEIDGSGLTTCSGFVEAHSHADLLGTDYQRTSRPSEIEAMKELLREALGTRLVKQRNEVYAPRTRHHQNQWPASRAGENACGIYAGPKGEIITGRDHGPLVVMDFPNLEAALARVRA